LTQANTENIYVHNKIGKLKLYVHINQFTEHHRQHLYSVSYLPRHYRIGARENICINTKNTTESKQVGIDDAIGQILWTLHFLAKQSMYVQTTKISQDKNSTILLSVNVSLEWQI